MSDTISGFVHMYTRIIHNSTCSEVVHGGMRYSSRRMTFMLFVMNYYSKVKPWLGFEIHKWRKNCKIACGIELYPVKDILLYALQHTSSSHGKELEMSLWHHYIGAMMSLWHHQPDIPSFVFIVAVCGIFFMCKRMRRIN